MAQIVLGVCYLDRVETKIDHKEAFRLLSAAAPNGAPRAMVHLGRMYAEGLGIPQSLPEAFRLFTRRLQRRENSTCKYSLAEFTLAGLGMTADAGTARKWYAMAAAQECGDKEVPEAKAYLQAHPWDFE